MGFRWFIRAAMCVIYVKDDRVNFKRARLRRDGKQQVYLLRSYRKGEYI